MTDIGEEVRNKIKRSVNLEFVRMEDDFDDTRSMRKELTAKLMENARGALLVGEDAETGIKVINATLKALEQTEKAAVSAISLKLRQSEMDAASADAAKNRIAVIIQATKAGAIENSFPSQELESHLQEMFDSDIEDFELKSSPKDLSD